MKVEDATALVTGAGSGIGRSTALALAERGARVLAVDLDMAAAEKTAAGCMEVGPEAWAFACDVADVAAVSELADRVHREHGALGVLVNNAGVGLSGRFDDMSLDDWRWISSVNLDGVVHGCHAFAGPMLEGGRGHVVNVSSGLAYTPTANEPAYVSTKAAVLALTLSLRAGWGPRGVGVSAVCPGFINTPIVERARYVGVAGDPERRARAERIFRRGHSPDKVARAILSAIRRDRALVNVGLEAKAGWMFHRLAPVRAQQRLARHLGRC